MPRQKILVVDSDPHILILLEKFLEEAGYETRVTWDSKEAVSWIDSEGFAAIIVGEHPQCVSCLEVVRKLRQQGDDTSCIVLDDPQSEAEQGELHAMAVRAVISRWNLKEVVQTVRSATSEPRHAA